MRKSVIALLSIIVLILSCQRHRNTADLDQQYGPPPKSKTYHWENAQHWLEKHPVDKKMQKIAFSVNRTDSANFAQMDSVIIPDDISGNIVYYLPFPLNVPTLKEVDKIIFFSYPAQAFATYEKGLLIYTGPTNMGRKKDPTPAGLYFTNWKAEKTTSTFNDEWDLYWNFNIDNKEGIGWHQYSLPGYPASHSCLRLQEEDARYLYDWADQWSLGDGDSIRTYGTPVVVFGRYDYDAPRPWLQLIANPQAIDITANELKKQSAPFLNRILSEQKKREKALAGLL